MYLEDYQVEDLMKFEQEQTEFYVPQTKYSSTGRAKLIFMVPKGGESMCVRFRKLKMSIVMWFLNWHR